MVRVIILKVIVRIKVKFRGKVKINVKISLNWLRLVFVSHTTD